MSTRAPQELQERNKQQLLEEKLKIHIKREFDLGEKVISLLKQKKAFETNLQEQLQAKEDLEKKLEEIIANKKTLEQKFFLLQRELREQQKSLRRRSRRITQTEEGSREDLKILRQEIRHLKEQLEILDMQKVEDHVRLSNKIKGLYDKESNLKQELQKISYQKEIVEEESQNTMQNFQELSVEHEKEKKEHEQQIEELQHKQAELETRIANLLDKKKRNERKLQQKIKSLRLSKAQLEEKVEHLKQQPSEVAQWPDPKLLQVIEEQEKCIRELKEKAHQRSTMLRVENESLKKEVEEMLTAQEKMSWENQMLESSLKGLQYDLAEYIQLKNKFEEAQREKEFLEEAFYEKIKFLEAHYSDETQYPQETSLMNQPQRENKENHRHDQKLQTEPPEDSRNTVQNDAIKKPEPPRKSWSVFNAKFLIPAIILIAIILGVVIYDLLPLRNVQNDSSNNMVLELPESELELPESELELPEGELEPVILAENGVSSSSDADKPKKNNKGISKTSEVQKKRQAVQPKRSVDIVVQLPNTQNNRFLPKEQEPFPTVENNSILRRHYERKETLQF